MKLYIDTTSSEKIIVSLDDKRFETDARVERSQKLLPFLDELLKKHNKTFEDITDVKVALGPGSFTGIRVGVSVANAIGWALKIADPVTPTY